MDSSHKTLLVSMLWCYYPTLNMALKFSLNSYYAFLRFLHGVLWIIFHCLCFLSAPQHKCMHWRHQITSLSYSTIALYNTDHTGVSVAHKITSPKKTASIFPTMIRNCWLGETKVFRLTRNSETSSTSHCWIFEFFHRIFLLSK